MSLLYRKDSDGAGFLLCDEKYFILQPFFLLYFSILFFLLNNMESSFEFKCHLMKKISQMVKQFLVKQTGDLILVTMPLTLLLILLTFLFDEVCFCNSFSSTVSALPSAGIVSLASSCLFLLCFCSSLKNFFKCVFFLGEPSPEVELLAASLTLPSAVFPWFTALLSL